MSYVAAPIRSNHEGSSSWEFLLEQMGAPIELPLGACQELLAVADP